MKIPETTTEFPYIQFTINEKGKIKYEKSYCWWGGINGGFISSDGFGNSCEPNNLKKYIKRAIEKEIKSIDSEVKNLENKKKILQNYGI